MVCGGGVLDESVFIRYRTGKEVPLNYFTLAATDGEHKVVIDTGSRLVSTTNNPKFHRTANEELEYLLKKHMGWRVEDVDTVINTHLHSDHCGRNYLFSNAAIYVQRAEWEAAHNLLPGEMNYDPFDYSKEQVSYFQWRFIEGDFEIYTGLHLIFAPGHTPGSQFVLLDTEEGTLCFAGDVVPMRANLEEFCEPGITSSSVDALRSIELVRRYADRIIYGHDLSVCTGMRSKFPTVPPCIVKASDKFWDIRAN